MAGVENESKGWGEDTAEKRDQQREDFRDNGRETKNVIK